MFQQPQFHLFPAILCKQPQFHLTAVPQPFLLINYNLLITLKVMFVGDLQQAQSPPPKINQLTNSSTNHPSSFLFSQKNTGPQQSASKQQSSHHQISYQYIAKPPPISTKDIQFSNHEDTQKYQQLRNNKKKASTNATLTNKKTEFLYKQPPTYLSTPYKKRQELPNDSKFVNKTTQNCTQQNCKQPPNESCQSKPDSTSSNTISHNSSFLTYNSNSDKACSIYTNPNTSISANIMNTFYKEYYPNRNISKMGDINSEKHKCFRDTLNLKSQLAKLQKKYEQLQYDHYILQKKYSIYQKEPIRKNNDKESNDISRVTSKENHNHQCIVEPQITMKVQEYQMNDASDNTSEFHIKKLQQEKLQLTRQCLLLKDQLQKYSKTENLEIKASGPSLPSQKPNTSNNQSNGSEDISLLAEQNKKLRSINKQYQRRLNENYTKNIERQLQIQAIREQYHRDMSERANYIKILTQKYESIKGKQQSDKRNVEDQQAATDNQKIATELQLKNLQLNQINKLHKQLKLTNQSLQEKNNQLCLQIKQLKISQQSIIDKLEKNQKLLEQALNDYPVLEATNIELCGQVEVQKQQKESMLLQIDRLNQQIEHLQEQLEQTSQERNQEKEWKIVESGRYLQLAKKSEEKQNELLKQIQILKQSILMEQEKNLSYRNILSQKQSISQNALAKYQTLVQENKKFLQVLQSKAQLFAEETPKNEQHRNNKQQLTQPEQSQSSQALKQKKKQLCIKCQRQLNNLQKEELHNQTQDNPEKIESQAEIQEQSLLQICDILGIEPIKNDIIGSIKECLKTNQEMALITDFYIQVLDLFGIGYTQDTGEDSEKGINEAIFINSETQQQLLKEITSFRQGLKNLLSKTKELQSLNDRLIKENSHLKRNNKKLDASLNENILSKYSSLLFENNLQLMKMKAIILSFQYRYQQQREEQQGATIQYRPTIDE